MRWLVCGGRDFTDRVKLYTVLGRLTQARGWPEVLIEGEARGADTLARVWAEGWGVEVEPYPADWDRYHRAAGPIRNRQMLKEGKPDLVVAFYDKPVAESKGTADMVRQSRKAGVEVIEVEVEWSAV